MTIRTKIWLIAVSVAMTVGVASWGRLYLGRNKIIKDAQTSAEELAHDIVADLKSIEADADDRDLEEKLYGYVNRHTRIVRLDLYVDREADTPSSRIVAPRGDRPEITRMAPFHRQPLFVTKQGARDAREVPIELPVDLQGPWKATLVMKWTLGPVEAMLETEERISIIFGIGLLVTLTLFSGFITHRVVGKPLEALAGAMRDVEAGDLSRRVPVDTVDEVGRLSQGFNRMLERLSKADAQIRAFNQRLAGEIEAATRDLSEKNATLAQLNRLLFEMRRENASKVRLATLGQLAAQLAHEIGTPLSSVSGHIQLALLQRDLHPALRERLEVSGREIERISRIVRDYLDSTRPLEPEQRPTPVAKLLEEAVELTRGMEPAAPGTAVVETKIDPKVGELVTDPGLLRQIVLNLLSNALDAVDRKGTVLVTAKPLGEEVLITVSDTGHGIAPDDLRRIFEPFYTTKGRGKGTGLGLAICRQLTGALGGTISVESKPGAGSTFSIKLPRHGAPKGAEPSLRAASGGRVTRVLVAEDDRVARDLLGEILRAEGFEVEAVDDGAGAIERASTGIYDLVVSDVRMERSSGLDVLKVFTEKAPGTPVILITAFGDVSGAMEAIQRGAYDYVSKPFNIEELKLTVKRALERRRLMAENKTVPSDGKTHIEDIVGKSPVMLEVYKLVARVAASTATVLVNGESGTGKELVARAIHSHSPRVGRTFVPVNCTALTESLLESELFGHARGAFTGAIATKKGLFEMASGGTLFLDEIGDMGPKMQSQLLRTLQDGEVRPVGSSEAIKVDVRLVCATNKDLDDEVKAGRFREDLFFRINVVTVTLPPLRDRPGDIPILVAHFLKKLARREGRPATALSSEALDVLTHYRWPGNVRELENAVERASAVAKGNVILPSDLPPEVLGGEPPRPSGIIDDRPTLAELERRYIALMLSESAGNKKKAAEKLGIDRRTLYRALERTGDQAGEPDDDESFMTPAAPSPPPPMLELVGVSKQFGATGALEAVDLSVRAGSTTVLLGPSGCGKSTLLRMIVGLVTADRGQIRFDGQVVAAENLSAVRQRIGYVIQDGGLFPHLTAEENMVLMARHLGWDETRIRTRRDELVALTRFPTSGLGRYPGQLSGGQRQRVSLMRALMLDPAVLLLDEPLGALDPMIRADLQDDLRAIFRQLGKTVVLVTHDIGEAGFFGDVIVLMRGGQVVQRGSLEDLLERPGDPFVTRFINAQRGILERRTS